jgi:DNA-binding beta-propeller fold protein YncE
MWTWRRSGAPVALLGAVGAVLAFATPAAASIQLDGQWGSASLPPPLGPADGSFSAPSRAATDSSNNIYVTDSGNSRVQKFNSTGTFLSKFGAPGIGNGQFLPASAAGVAVDSAGNVYVVDKLSNRVQKFNSAGTFVASWGTAGNGNGQFSAPTGIAVDPSSGSVYVADTGNNRIQKFTSSGVYVYQWGTVGTGDGSFASPSGVAVDSNGDVYVADSGNSRIQKFTSSGAFVTKWGSLGTGDGQFGATTATPLDLAIGSSDNVIVVDPTNNRVQKFRPIGTFITKWGTTGSGSSQFTLPSGVAISSADEVYVVDSGNSRVERFHETDTTAPDTAIDSGPSGTTNADVSFTFSSSESPLLGFECKLDSAEWEACGASKSYSNLSEGSHTVQVRAVDSAGNPDASPVSRTWSVDRTPPNTTIDSGPSGTTNDASPQFAFSASEPGSSFECRLDSSQESDFGSCSSPKTYSSLADGSHTVEVRATDAVGNTDQTPASRGFTVDTTPPTVTAPVPRLLPGPTMPVHILWSGGDNQTSQANLRFDLRKRSYQEGAWGSWSSTLANTSRRAISTRLSLGTPYQYQVRSRDQVGNVSTYKATRPFTPRLAQEAVATYTGTWRTQSQSRASAGTVKTSSQAGATATFAFAGKGVGVVMPLRSTLGSVKICLDPGRSSSSCNTVNLSSGTAPKRIVFARNRLYAGIQHHVKVTVVSGRADLDAFALLR